ncbi:MAG TPA: hypothetical protein VJ302_22380 [Blastocatellia bacterium]|nr:hypothetical protein [Blastocatellia bacterium]
MPHPAENLPDQIPRLFPQQRFQLIRRGMWKEVRPFGLSQSLVSRGLSEVSNDQVSDHPPDEPRQFLRFSQVSLPNLFNHDPEGILVQIIGNHPIAKLLADDEHDAPIILLDQFDLGLPIAGSYPANEIAPAAEFTDG